MRSNLTLRSNVFVREGALDLYEDTSFCRQIRGRVQIKRLVELHEADPRNDQEVANLTRRGLITETQRETLMWMIGCYICNCYPVGETFDGLIEFRCSVEGCPR